MADFALEISRFVNKTKDRQDLVVRKIVLQIYNGVVQKNPVDTGRSQNNWNVGISQLDPTVTEEAVQNKRSVIEKARRIIQRIKGGQTIWVTNNVSYINRLEDGYSDQAPAGMVSVTLQEIPGITRQSVNEAKRERP